MKLLRDVCLYAIMVDYFMIDSKTDEEYTEPLFLSIDTETKKKDETPANIIIFENEITDHLRVFDTKEDAEKYISSHFDKNCCYCENQKVIKLNLENREWEEC